MTAPERPVVLVTGVSAGGLGQAVASRFAGDGFGVIASDAPTHADALEQLVGSLVGANIVAETADVTSEEDVDRLVDRALKEFGRLDALVNCAGVMLRKDVFETSLAEWQSVIDVNLTGTWLLDRAVGRVLCAAGAGTIVNVASVYADRAGLLPESAYYASKAGISNLTRGLAAEFGAAGVTVNCVAPGVFYPTAMTASLGGYPEVLAQMTKRTMLGRLGEPARDIGGVVRFLASPDARYITGQTIFVDGGWSAW